MNPSFSSHTMQGRDLHGFVALCNKCLPRDPINRGRFLKILSWSR